MFTGIKMEQKFQNYIENFFVFFYIKYFHAKSNKFLPMMCIIPITIITTFIIREK